MRKSLECGTELATGEAIIFHTCEAYPPREEFSWLDVALKEEGDKNNG